VLLHPNATFRERRDQVGGASRALVIGDGEGSKEGSRRLTRTAWSLR
jgi:hypothetical protein